MNYIKNNRNIYQYNHKFTIINNKIKIQNNKYRNTKIRLIKFNHNNKIIFKNMDNLNNYIYKKLKN